MRSANDLSEVPRAVIRTVATQREVSQRELNLLPHGKSDENMAKDVADRVGMFRSWKRQHTQFYQLAPYLEATLTRGKKYGRSWFNGVTFSQIENQSDRCVQTQFSGARRDQLRAGVRQANAKIQFGGDFSRIDRPRDFDRTFIRHLVGFQGGRVPS